MDFKQFTKHHLHDFSRRPRVARRQAVGQLEGELVLRMKEKIYTLYRRRSHRSTIRLFVHHLYHTVLFHPLTFWTPLRVDPMPMVDPMPLLNSIPMGARTPKSRMPSPKCIEQLPSTRVYIEPLTLVAFVLWYIGRLSRTSLTGRCASCLYALHPPGA